MENYNKENHLLQFDAEYNELRVYQLVCAIPITEEPVKVAVEGDDYVVGIETCGDCHRERIMKGKLIYSQFKDGDFIGAADIRDMRINTYIYHLDVCPAHFKKEGPELVISSECSAGCASPKTGCREIQTREC